MKNNKTSITNIKNIDMLPAIYHLGRNDILQRDFVTGKISNKKITYTTDRYSYWIHLDNERFFAADSRRKNPFDGSFSVPREGLKFDRYGDVSDENIGKTIFLFYQNIASGQLSEFYLPSDNLFCTIEAADSYGREDAHIGLIPAEKYLFKKQSDAVILQQIMNGLGSLGKVQLSMLIEEHFQKRKIIPEIEWLKAKILNNNNTKSIAK